MSENTTPVANSENVAESQNSQPGAAVPTQPASDVKKEVSPFL